MGRLDGKKLPFAPWADRDHPEADPDQDARYKWGLTENYVDGETVALAEDDPRLGGRVFIQTDSDPVAFVDGDDVRCPETDAVHPEFLELLDRIGPAYADVSTSGAGVHAYYTGDLPGDQSQAVFEIDADPWGANDDPPTVEIYTGKHVCVTTGDHVDGTPRDVRPWDPDAVAAILDEYDARKETTTPDHDTDQDLDLDGYDPEATAPGETTTDARDIALAVDRLRPRDLPLRTRQVDTDATGWEKWDPSTYRTSSGNDSLHRPPREPVFHDHKHGEAFGVLSLFAAEQGILSKPWDRLAGADWWDAVEAAREAGAPIPEYDGPTDDGESEPVAVLPPAVRDLSRAASGWDWKHAARDDGSLTVDEARDRTVDAIADAYDRGDRVLVEALPTMGKSYGAVLAAARTGNPITFLTGRGHKEQYDQVREWCDEQGLSYYTLPSFTRDCDTANGEHGEDWKQTVRDWYARGATPQEIHKSAEYALGRPLPCQEHDGHSCPYASQWDFDPDEFDVLIGHYNHAHKSKVTAGRTVVFDEFPDAFETKPGRLLPGAVSQWLETTPGVPFDSFADLLEHRDDEARRGEALLWFEDHGVDPDETDVFDDATAHAAAPLFAFTLLAGEDLGNGFERATLDDGSVGAFDRARGQVTLLRPPDLTYASGVVALDGTPTPEMWDLALGQRLNHRPVLQPDERAEYITDALNLNLVRTTEYVKPYNSSDHVNTDADAALLEAVAEQHGDRPDLITTAAAEHEYDAAGVLDLVDETKHYGNVLGSNALDDSRLGAVIGSNHYGDQYIKKWGAYAGETVEREAVDDDGPAKGENLTYGTFGDTVHRHMTEHDTLQAAMRFGRDGNGAVVYVHTDTLPDWVPVAGEGRVLKTWSDGRRQVLAALEDLGTATTEAVVEHPAVDLSRQQVFDHLEDLRDRGRLDRHQDPDDGRRVVWVDDGIHRVTDHGEVDLDPVDLEDLDENEVRQLARSSIYTWQFTNRPGGSDTPVGQAADDVVRTSQTPPTDGDPPPERVD